MGVWTNQGGGITEVATYGDLGVGTEAGEVKRVLETNLLYEWDILRGWQNPQGLNGMRQMQNQSGRAFIGALDTLQGTLTPPP